MKIKRSIEEIQAHLDNIRNVTEKILNDYQGFLETFDPSTDSDEEMHLSDLLMTIENIRNEL